MWQPGSTMFLHLPLLRIASRVKQESEVRNFMTALPSGCTCRALCPFAVVI